LLVLLALAVPTWLLADLLGSGDHLCHRDWIAFFSWAEGSRRTMLEHGQLPLWAPYFCGGSEDLGNPQTVVLSPFFPLVLLLGAVRGLKIFAWVHFVLGFWGGVRLARLLGVGGLWGAVPATLLSACGFHLWHLNAGHIPMLQFHWLPWILEGYLAAWARPARALAGAAALGVATLSGGTYTAPFAGLLIGAHAVLSTAVTRPWWRPVAAAGAVVGGGLVLGAAKAIPALVFVRRFRALAPLDDVLTPMQLARTLFDPRPWDMASGLPWGLWEYGNYVGTGAAVFALLGVVALRRSWPWLVLGVLCLLLTMGTFAPWAPYRQLHRLPLFASLRAPGRCGVLAVTAFALAGTQGLAALLGSIGAARGSIAPGARLALAALGLWVVLPMLRHNRALLPDAVCRQAPWPSTRTTAFHLELAHADTFRAVWRGLGAIQCWSPDASVPRSPHLWAGDRPQVDVRPLTSGRARLVRFTPARWHVRAKLRAGAVVRLNQNHRPGFVPSRGTLVDATGLVGARLEPGTHDLVVTYRAPEAIAGLAVSGAGWTALVALWAVGRRRRIRPAVGAPV
jgi:hypothetical protein